MMMATWVGAGKPALSGLGPEPLRVLELFAPPPAAGASSAYARAQPYLEVSRYAVDLRAFSHGSATFTRTFARYETMPDNVAAKFREKVD